MFENVGGKIKSLSVGLCILLIVIIVIATALIAIAGGLVESDGAIVTQKSVSHYRANSLISPVLIIIYGLILCFCVYFFSLLTYGIGQLIENTSIKK